MPLDMAAMQAEQAELMDQLDAADGEIPATEPAQSEVPAAPELAPGEASAAPTPVEPPAGGEATPATPVEPAPPESGEPTPAVDPKDAQIAQLTALVNQLAGGKPVPAAETKPAAAALVTGAAGDTPMPAPTPPAASAALGQYQPQDFLTAEEAAGEGLDSGVLNTAFNRLGEHLWKQMARLPEMAQQTVEDVRAQIRFENFMTDFFAMNKDLADVRDYVGHSLMILNNESQAQGKTYPDTLSLLQDLATKVRTSLGRVAPAGDAEVKTVDAKGNPVPVAPALSGAGTGRRGGPPAPKSGEAKTQAELMAELDAVDV